MGRPTSLAQVVRKDDAGHPVTVADAIVASLRAGNYMEAAAPAAGVSKDSVYQWLKDGARCNTAYLKGDSKLADFSRYERLTMSFSDAVADAQGQAEADDVARLALLAAGGLERTITTVKVDADGKELERTTRTETLMPDASVIEWRLERRFQARWGRLERIEHSGPDGEPIPVEVRAARIREAAEQLDASRPELTVVSESEASNGQGH